MPELSHLLDPDPNAVPVLPLPPKEYARPMRMEGDGSIQVSKSDDGATLSLDDDSQPPASISAITTFDPLSYMSFRAFLVNNGTSFSVVTAVSYISYVYYERQWFFDQFEIPSETISAGALSAPMYLYAKIPVKFFSGLDGITIFVPRDIFVSDPQTISSLPYTFVQETQSGYITRDRIVTPDSYFLLTETPNPSNIITIPPGESSGTGMWHFLIAGVTQAGIQQVHLGILTLPQAFTFQFVSLNVT